MYVCVVGLVCGYINTCMLVWINIEYIWMIRLMLEWAGYVGVRYRSLKCVQLPCKLG